jgi:hypothetical protein
VSRTFAGAAPIAERVRPEADDDRAEVVLRVTRGLFSRGRVTAGEGVDLSGAQPVCRALDGPAHVSRVRFDGAAFALGPLVPGRYRVQGRLDSCVAKCEFADAGADDVVLEFVIGGALSGRVVDGRSGEPATALIFPYRNEPSGGSIEGRRGSELDSHGLVPGAYTLVATTGDDRIGALGVEVESERELTGLEVALEPGALLELSCLGGGDGVIVTAYRGELCVGVELARPERVEQLLVPPGRLTIVERAPDLTEIARREVIAVAGVTQSLGVGR